MSEGSERYINPYTDFGFKKLFDQAEIARYSEAERWEYEESKKVFWDNYSVMKTAIKKSLAQGLAQGREEANIENARKMKAKGFAVADIADITGLSVENIERL